MSSYRTRPGAEGRSVQALIDPDLPTVDLVEEARFGKIAGACALGSVLTTIAAVPVAATDVAHRGKQDSDDLEKLRTLGQSGAGQEAGLALRVFGALLLIVVAVFFYRAIKGRKPDHYSWIPVLGIASFVILSAAIATQFFEVRSLAHDFLALPGDQQTNSQASHILDHPQTLLRLANITQLVAGVGFGLWISLTSFEATTVGLLTRFVGIFGLGAGLLTAIPVFAVGTALFLAWLGSVGVLAWGYWSGGRPPAWETGQATLPWEQQGDAPGAGRRPQSEGGAG